MEVLCGSEQVVRVSVGGTSGVGSSCLSHFRAGRVNWALHGTSQPNTTFLSHFLLTSFHGININVTTI